LNFSDNFEELLITYNLFRGEKLDEGVTKQVVKGQLKGLI
jgi:hypothetical protein